MFAALGAAAQHDISKVDPAPADSVIATPVPERYERRMKKYEMPELAGAEQALGSQLIDGRLRKPLVDFLVTEGDIEQRISIFEAGLVVVKMSGAGSIHKKVLIPPDALASYVANATPAALRAIEQESLPVPEAGRRALLRIYDTGGAFVERRFHPGRVLPKRLMDQLMPLRDLLRVVSEDRGVTTSVAGYQPKPGDELVADDQKIYRVVAVTEEEGVVELRCLDAPTTIFVARKDLHLYFIGARPSQPREETARR